MERMRIETGIATRHQELPDVGWHGTGSVRLACDGDRLDDFHHHAGIAETAGVPLELVSPQRAVELFPLLDPDGVVAAAWMPTDGHVDPTSLTNAYAAGATARGARILRQTPVTALAQPLVLGTTSYGGPGTCRQATAIPSSRFSHGVVRHHSGRGTGRA